MNKIKILLLTAILLTGIVVTVNVIQMNLKLHLILMLQNAASLPTGQVCIDALGWPTHMLDGKEDYEFYTVFTPFRDKEYFLDKKLYFWPESSFAYIIAVIDKNTDKVAFITSYRM